MKKEQLTEDQKRTLWLVKMRWAAIMSIAVIILLSKFIGDLTIEIVPCLIILAAAIAYNFIFPLFIERYPTFSKNQIFMYFRMLLDLSVVTGLIHFTGGTESSFSLLYLLEVCSVSIFGFQTLGYIIAAHAAIFYALLCKLESLSIIPHYRIISTPGTLYLDPSYIYNRSASLYLISIILVYMTSYLSDRLRDKQKEIEELSNARLDFMNMVVHELRSPMTSLFEYTSLFLEGLLGALDDKQKGIMHSMKKQIRRLSQMVSDLLDLARLESGKIKLDKQPANINSILEQALAELAPQISEKKIAVSRNLDMGIPQAYFDKDKILEVFINLISNSINFSRAGGRIVISIGHDDKYLKVSIKDEGHGIDPDDIEHIFQKFYRARHEDSKYKGTGLGLAICRGILDLHNGSIRAESAGLQKGATFYFTLPLK